MQEFRMLNADGATRSIVYASFLWEERITCFITNRAFDILLLIPDSCFLHDRDSSKVIPRNLHEVTLLNITLSIFRLWRIYYHIMSFTGIKG